MAFKVGPDYTIFPLFLALRFGRYPETKRLSHRALFFSFCTSIHTSVDKDEEQYIRFMQEGEEWR